MLLQLVGAKTLQKMTPTVFQNCKQDTKLMMCFCSDESSREPFTEKRDSGLTCRENNHFAAGKWNSRESPHGEWVSPEGPLRP